MFKKKNTKVPFVVVLSFSRITVAEIAKNTIKDDQILKKSLIRDKSHFDHSDFMFLNFVNDDDKVYRVIFQILMKNKEKMRQKLFAELKYMFDCSDIEIIYKQDFDFNKYNLKNGLVKGEIYNNSSFANQGNKNQGLKDQKDIINSEEVKRVSSPIANEQNKQYISEYLEPNKLENLNPTINHQNIDDIGKKQISDQNNYVQKQEQLNQSNQINNQQFDNQVKQQGSSSISQQEHSYNKNNPFE